MIPSGAIIVIPFENDFKDTCSCSVDLVNSSKFREHHKKILALRVIAGFAGDANTSKMTTTINAKILIFCTILSGYLNFLSLK